ncbi:transcription initiation factor TFIID subunit 11-like isoform X2 [Olea europaea var. sylvestris]|uniref:transcription initiation factor TFIID subunit 11-like isoform X2 n=1 Tax=Olea europaea var. sylvestris TaxID=158386 RepID=UPI000C1D3AE0|nr:transcription initiation factor TFIID subunit 11-like isoform X2 [Olea europaea var. sylvestris]
MQLGFPMKKSKDPFEVAFEEQDVSPPESPTGPDENEEKTRGALTLDVSGDDDMANNLHLTDPSTSAAASNSVVTAGPVGKSKEEDEEEEEENMDVELGKFPSSGDPDKVAIMQSILSQFTEEQMSRYESFRRSGFQKSNMKRLLTSITGSAKISMPMTIVVSGIAKMFVGELVETARIVMADRGESGPIRPCHMREAYRRLKLEGKIPKRSVPRLFC